MAKGLKMTKCPYCKGRVSYITGFIIKTKGEYVCNTCKGVSNVLLNKTLYAVASGICILALLIMMIYTSSCDHGDPIGILLVLLPFIAFYLIVPFFVRLEPCKDKTGVDNIKKSVSVPSAVTRKNAVRIEEEEPVRVYKGSAAENSDDDIGIEFTKKFMIAKNRSENDKSEYIEEIDDLMSQSENDRKEDIYSS